MRQVDEVAPGIHAISGLKTGRSYIIADREALTLVDTSTHGVADPIIEAIGTIGRRVEDLRTIVATHYHHDHTGNVAALRERSGANLWAHAADAPYIDGRESWLGLSGAIGRLIGARAPRQYSLTVDRELCDGDLLPVAGGLRVVHAPGHTPGHIALYAAERSVLFAGDALMNTFGLRLPIAIASHDMDEARRSARLLATLEYDVALPGHGNPVLSRASEKVREWSRQWL